MRLRADRRSNTARKLLCSILCLVLAWAIGRPTYALATTSGISAFQAQFTLPTFPCDGCGGSVAGTAAITIAGSAQDGLPYSASWPDPTSPSLSNNFAASYLYQLFCPEATRTVPPVVTTGVGNFTLSGGILQHGLQTSHGAQLAGWLIWTSGGPGILITLGGLTVSDGSNQVVAQSDAPGANLLDAQIAASFALEPAITSCQQVPGGEVALVDGIGFESL